MRGTIATIAFLLWMTCPAAALVQSGKVNETGFTVYAPDWTWQKCDINILIVFENPAPHPVAHTVELVVPVAFKAHFGYAGAASIPSGALTRTVTVPANETARTAITKITALDGFPLQLYPLSLRIAQEGGAGEQEIAYSMQTVRGAAVNPGKWALYLPVGVALAFCLVFVLVIRRFAAPGAWRRPNEPVTPTNDRPAWVEQEP
ncbi:MAG TPA: hypothetical protein PLJ71_02510 [Candidatus Hydrogenedentes bacterium]|nr:hypothetical protein [Candidatus Hydrogenedentota bacterium]HQM47527.1 hypothetical protein [Candidatus Hydrogenedentota bacterium]